VNIITKLTKKEPALLLGTFFSLVAYIASQVADAPPEATWTTLGPVVALAVFRFFNDSPETVERKQAEAHAAGIETAKQQMKVARSMAAQKGAEARALKVVAPAAPAANPKPQVKKRSTRKSIVIPPTTKLRTNK
jgi:hypothetical protein